MYFTSFLHEKGADDNMLHYYIPRGMRLHEGWAQFITDACNNTYGDEITVPFTFDTAVPSAAWKTKEERLGSLYYMQEKMPVITSIATMANQLSVHRGLRIHGFEARLLGRVIAWCKAHFGITTWQAEKIHTRRGRGARQEEGVQYAYARPEGEVDAEIHMINMGVD